MADGSTPHVYYGSRLKAGALFLASCGFVAVGWWLVGLGTFSAEAIGWLSIAFFSPLALSWLIGIFARNRLIIHPDGFSVKQWFLPEKRYSFSDIAALRVSRRQRVPLVVWTYKKRPEALGEIKGALG